MAGVSRRRCLKGPLRSGRRRGRQLNGAAGRGSPHRSERACCGQLSMLQGSRMRSPSTAGRAVTTRSSPTRRRSLRFCLALPRAVIGARWLAESMNVAKFGHIKHQPGQVQSEPGHHRPAQLGLDVPQIGPAQRVPETGDDPDPPATRAPSGIRPWWPTSPRTPTSNTGPRSGSPWPRPGTCPPTRPRPPAEAHRVNHPPPRPGSPAPTTPRPDPRTRGASCVPAGSPADQTAWRPPQPRYPGTSATTIRGCPSMRADSTR